MQKGFEIDMFGYEPEFVVCGDARIAYYDVGRGKPLVLLHGNGEDSSYWNAQIPELTRFYRVIAVDSRGHGASQAVRLKKLFQNQQLTSLDIQQILSEEKPNQQEVMKISAERLQAVLPQGLNAAETEDYAIKACEHYRKFQRGANRNDEVQHERVMD